MLAESSFESSELAEADGSSCSEFSERKRTRVRGLNVPGQEHFAPSFDGWLRPIHDLATASH